MSDSRSKQTAFLNEWKTPLAASTPRQHHMKKPFLFSHIQTPTDPKPCFLWSPRQPGQKPGGCTHAPLPPTRGRSSAPRPASGHRSTAGGDPTAGCGSTVGPGALPEARGEGNCSGGRPQPGWASPGGPQPEGEPGRGMAAGLGQAEVVLGAEWVLGGCGVRLKQGAPRGKVWWSLFCTCVPTSGLGDFFIRFLLVLF